LDIKPKTLKELDDWPNMAPHHFYEKRHFPVQGKTTALRGNVHKEDMRFYLHAGIQPARTAVWYIRQYLALFGDVMILNKKYN